ncbi:alginate lyase family protein [Rubellicoccus peritrichatus]|uniref:Alginate lyase family protein n=1 Tax=Rubellicoccus peritrichatus TaxID=3080537 RepID=A0AAQ3QY95_9BACT|nr:alginate lyase family protein [Puniceicoccus sp. CR14]WOO43590.1 alginate lyase family protein [Puniceicoccus sp. CR14]
MNLIKFVPIMITCCFGIASANQSPPKLDRENQFAEQYPERYAELIDALNLDYPGLEKVKAALQEDDTKTACNELIAYYRTSQGGTDFRPIDWSKRSIWKNPDEMIEDIYEMQKVKSKVPRAESGYLDWKFNPEQSGFQFSFLISRMGHQHSSLQKFHVTNDPKYIKYVYDNLRDFILGSPQPDFSGRHPNTDLETSEFPWVTLNAAYRLKNVPEYFYNLLQLEEFYADQETLLLILSSLAEHGEFINTYGMGGDGNWATTQLESLVKFSSYFPELKKSQEWAQEATERYAEMIDRSIYPDGGQIELAPGYALIVFRSSLGIYNTLKKSGYPIPEALTASMNRQLNYFAWIMKPNGRLLCHNDGDPDTYARDEIIEAARELNNQEALYIATGGQEGIRPEGPPSRFLEWSGFAISSDGYGENVQWSGMNIGPLGIGHQHADQLSFELYNQREILVDPGRYAYSWTGGWVPYYFHTLRGHNTVSVDGGTLSFMGYDESMLESPKSKDSDVLKDYRVTNNHLSIEPLGEYEKFEITPASDFFLGRTLNPYAGKRTKSDRMPGDAVHERAMHYERGKFWVVVDRITSDRSRELEAYWHFHPHCEAVEILRDGSVATQDADKGNLLIVPIAGNVSLKGKLYKGQEQPFKQGWFSERMNEKQPSWDAVYSTKAGKKANFGWLLVPFEGEYVPKASAELRMRDNFATIKVVVDGQRHDIEMEFNELPELRP